MRTLIRGSAVCVAVVSALLAGAVPLAVAEPGARADTATTTALPTDPKASGYVGLCDENGHNVVGGNVNAKPFIWKAVASVPPPAAYEGPGQNAILNAYQPRPGTQPADWSGSALTSASFYVSRRTPTVQATYADQSLAQFMTAFPPQVNGLYVLRIFWGKRNYGLYNASYPTTTIQVRGDRWHVVSGGTVACGTVARATSLEQLTGVVSKADITPRTPARDLSLARPGTSGRIVTKPANVGAGSTVSGAASVAGGSDPSAVPARDSAAAASSSASTHGWVLWSLVGIVALLALALAMTTTRGRRARPQIAAEDPKDAS